MDTAAALGKCSSPVARCRLATVGRKSPSTMGKKSPSSESSSPNTGASAVGSTKSKSMKNRHRTLPLVAPLGLMLITSSASYANERSFWYPGFNPDNDKGITQYY